MLVSAVVAICGCGPDANSPYGKGYEFGKQAGRNDRKYDKYDVDGAKMRANMAGDSGGNPYEIGTDEYGSFIKGLESGYYAGHE